MPARRAAQGMLPLPPRAGFARLDTGSHTGFNLASERVRPGRNVFGRFAWSWGALKANTFQAGKDAARLAATFGWARDPMGEYRMSVEIIWSFRYATLLNIPGAQQVLGPKVWAILETYPDLVIVESNLGTVEEFASYAGDLAIVLLHPEANGEYDVPKVQAAHVHRPGTDVRYVIGTITLKLGRNQAPVSVKSFRATTADDTLDDTIHDKFGSAEAVADGAEIPPCAADKYIVEQYVVPRCGGIEIGAPMLEGGELLMAGCDLARMYVIEHYTGTIDNRTAFATALATADLSGGTLHEGRRVVWCLECVDEEGLQRLLSAGQITDEATKAQLKLPVSERQWLRGQRELILGERTVPVFFDDIVRMTYSVNVTVASELALTMAPTDFYTFEGRLQDGAFKPVGRVSATAAAVVAQRLAIPAPASTAKLAQAHIKFLMMSRASDPNASLEPLVINFHLSYVWLLALVDLRLAMQPTCDDEQILTLVFKDDAQFKELLGFSAWPQPTEKSRLAMQKVSIPPMTDGQLLLREAYNHLGVRGTKALRFEAKKAKSELSFIEFDKKTSTCTVVANVSTFVCTKRVGGAGLGAGPPAKGMKYDLVQGWIMKTAPASLPSNVLSTYALSVWPHGR